MPTGVGITAWISPPTLIVPSGATSTWPSAWGSGNNCYALGDAVVYGIGVGLGMQQLLQRDRFQEVLHAVAAGAQEAAQAAVQIGCAKAGHNNPFVCAPTRLIASGLGRPPATYRGSTHEMLANLAAGNEAVVKAARSALNIAEEAGDQATADLMTQRVSVGEKAAWMLRAHLAK